MLVDPVVLDMTLDCADISKDDIVLEIGTGDGFLTKELCGQAKVVVSYEVDKELFEKARRTLGMHRNLILLLGDGLKSDHEFDVFVSNLPYSRSREAIEWLVGRDFDRAIVMVQKEFASKLLSGEGDNYRAISVVAQYCFNIEHVMNVYKESFSPMPKVDSVLLKMTRKGKMDKNTMKALKRLFSFKGRKVKSVMKKLNVSMEIDGERRVESLNVKEAVRLAGAIAKSL